MAEFRGCSIWISSEYKFANTWGGTYEFHPGLQDTLGWIWSASTLYVSTVTLDYSVLGSGNNRRKIQLQRNERDTVKG